MAASKNRGRRAILEEPEAAAADGGGGGGGLVGSGGGGENDVVAQCARVALESWCYGNPRKRDAIWAVVSQEMSCRAAGQLIGGVSKQLVAEWVRQYKQMAREVLPLAGVMVGE